MNLQTVHPVTAHPGAPQCRHNAIANLIQHGHRRHRITVVLRDTTINHHTGSPLLSPPRLTGNQRVCKKAFRAGNSPQMAFHFAQPGFRKRRSLRVRFHIPFQIIKIRIHVIFILAEELHHPGMRVILIKAVLQCVLHHVPDLFKTFLRTPFGRRRRHVINSPYRHSVIQQQTLCLIQVLHPGKKIDN